MEATSRHKTALRLAVLHLMTNAPEPTDGSVRSLDDDINDLRDFIALINELIAMLSEEQTETG